MRLNHLPITILAGVMTVTAACAATQAPASKLPPGTSPVTYAVVPGKSFLDERKKVFSLGLAVAIDWKKVPAAERQRLVPLITKDVRLRNCISLSRNANMSAYFKRSGAKMQITVVDAHGVPMLSTTMTLKNCPAPKKG